MVRNDYIFDFDAQAFWKKNVLSALKVYGELICPTVSLVGSIASGAGYKQGISTE